MTKVLWSLILTGVVAVPAFAQAKEMTCKPVSAVRCRCPASLQVQCPGYDQPYYLKDREKAQSATLTIQPKSGEAKTLVLKKPKSTVRELWAPEYSKEVQALLKKKGIKLEQGDTVTLTSFDVKSSTTLYTAPGEDGAKTMKGVSVAKPVGGESK